MFFPNPLPHFLHQAWKLKIQLSKAYHKYPYPTIPIVHMVRVNQPDYLPDFAEHSKPLEIHLDCSVDIFLISFHLTIPRARYRSQIYQTFPLPTQKTRLMACIPTKTHSFWATGTGIMVFKNPRPALRNCCASLEISISSCQMLSLRIGTRSAKC